MSFSISPGNMPLHTDDLGSRTAYRDISQFHHMATEIELSVTARIGKFAADEALQRLTKEVCQRHGLSLVRLSPIQKKFLTHHRCVNCGLIPLYDINLLHVKRVRCRRCGELTAFKRRGKYGRIRKEIAFEIAKEIKGELWNAIQ